MFTTAIIPVKHLHDSKRRLAHLLSADERADLIGRFLDNLLLTLSATPGIHRTLVVTCDPAVVGLARRRGVDVLLEAAADGLNTAAARGTAHAHGLDPFSLEQPDESAAGRVVSDKTHGERFAAQRLDVVDGVGAASETKIGALELKNQNRRFTGDALDAAIQELVDHEVGDHGDAPPLERADNFEQAASAGLHQ